MSLAIITEIEELLTKLKAAFSPAVNSEIKTIQDEVHDVINTAEDYIRVHGFQDLAMLAATFLTAMVPGGSWTVMLAALKAQAIANGLTLIEGAEDVVANKVKADLVATGKLPATVAAPAA